MSHPGEMGSQSSHGSKRSRKTRRRSDDGGISFASLKRTVLGFNAWLEACFAVRAVPFCLADVVLGMRSSVIEIVKWSLLDDDGGHLEVFGG